MKRIVLAIVAVALAGGLAAAQVQPRPIQDRFQFGRSGPLLTERDMQELKLSDTQKATVEKLVKEFDDKQKETLDKARDAVRNAGQDPDKRREALQKMTEASAEVRKLREDFVGKVKAVLDETQKKKAEEIFQRRPNRPDRPAFQLRNPNLGQILPQAAQDRLELTDKQKEELKKIQKEVDEKLNKLLTEEQKKKLEEMKAPLRGLPDRPVRPVRPDQPVRPVRPNDR